VVLDLAHLALLRQRVGEVTAPARRIHLLGAKPVDHRPAEHGLDAAAQPRRGLRLVVPDRAKHGEHERGVNVGNRDAVELGAIIVLGLLALARLTQQRHVPLRHVLGVLPLRLVFLDVLARRVAEGLGGRRLGVALGVEG
jgi:hypothetical protein